MNFIPYLHFDGTCAKAMEFYAQVFGGKDFQAMHFRDAPGGPPEWKGSDRIIHSQITTAMGVLMASDFPPGQGEKQQAVSIMTSAPDAATGEALYNRLLEGGDAVMPWGPTFFSAGFGMCRDRFGTHWMIGIEPPAK